MVGADSTLGEYVHFVFFVLLIALGSGILIFWVFLDVFTERFSFGRWRIPAAVAVFIASAALVPLWIAYGFVWVRVSNFAEPFGLKGALFVLILSFVCMVFSMAILQRAEGPGVRRAKFGCIVLGTAYVMSFVGLMIGYFVAG